MKRRRLITIYELIRKEGREPGGLRMPRGLRRLQIAYPWMRNFKLPKQPAWKQVAEVDVPGSVEIPQPEGRYLRTRFVVTGSVPTGTVKAYLEESGRRR